MLLSKRDANLEKKIIKQYQTSNTSNHLTILSCSSLSKKKHGARRFCRRLRRSPPSQAAGAAPVIFWAEKCQMFSGNFRWLGHIGLHPYISCRYLNSSTWNDHWDYIYIYYTLDYITLYCTVMSPFYHRLTCRSGAVSTRTCSPRAPTAGEKTQKQPPERIKKVAKGTKYLNIYKYVALIYNISAYIRQPWLGH